MIRLASTPLNSLSDAQAQLQTAIGVEFGTLPPYLYALYSIPSGLNPAAAELIKSVAMEEMIHMCLACNILNALGGNPVIRPSTYPGPLPGDIGPNGIPLQLHLYPFSQKAMEQAMEIEQPEERPDFPVLTAFAAVEEEPRAVTIGQFYQRLDQFLSTLPDTDWHAGRNQITDARFFPGQLFAINSYADAHRAIENIVSEGEGSRKGTVTNPLDFEDELAHYFRFGEIFHDRVLTRSDDPAGYTWGPERFGVDWNGVYPAISDPALHDFSQEPPGVQSAQNACNDAFAAMVNALQQAVSGTPGALGLAVRAMFDLRQAALHAFNVPLADGVHVAGPAFIYH